MKKLLSKGDYDIYQVDDGYVVHNRRMEGFAHSHIKNYKTATWIVDLSIKHKLPQNLPKYLVISLLRINDNEKYLININALLEKRNRKKIYYNSQKGIRKQR